MTAAGDDDTVPVVPFVPFRCPRCGRHKPRTHAVQGRLRRHQCQACGCAYRSLEMTLEEARRHFLQNPQCGSTRRNDAPDQLASDQ